MIALVISAAMFLLVVLVVLVIGASRETALDRRLAPYVEMVGGSRAEVLAQPFSERVLVPVTMALPRLLSQLMPAQSSDRMARKLEAAGLAWRIGPGAFMGLRLLVAFALMAPLVLLMIAARTPAGPMQLVFVALIGVLGFVLPSFLLGRRIRARRQRIEDDLPDAIDLVTVCVEAGQALDAALDRVARETHGPLAEEFAFTLDEISMGRPRVEALHDLGERSQVGDLMSFTTAVLQAMRMGVSIADVIRAQADQLRIRRRQRAEEKAMKAPVKLLFPTIFFLLPATAIVLIGPVGVKLVNFFSTVAFGTSVGH